MKRSNFTFITCYCSSGLIFGELVKKLFPYHLFSPNDFNGLSIEKGILN